jgi:hypothetical protein
MVNAINSKKIVRGREYRLAELYDNKSYAMNRADAHRIFGQISQYARVLREGNRWGLYLGTEKVQRG